MFNASLLLSLPPIRFFLLPAFILLLLGPILVLAQSPLPAALFYLVLLLSVSLLLRFTPRQSLRPAGTAAYFLLMVGLSLAQPYLFDSLIKFSDQSRRLPPDGLVNGTLYTWGYPITNNHLGFREREFVTPKPPGIYRIMILGDSMSWGVGLPVDQRYSDVLELLLNQRQSSLRFEVLNFATPAANTAEELKILKENLSLAEPDQIVIGFNFDDLGPSDQTVDPENRHLAAQYDRLIAPYLSRLRLHYLSGQLIKAIKQAATLTGFLPDQTTELKRQLDVQIANLDSFQLSLRQIKALTDSRRMPPPILAILERGLYTDRPTNYAAPDPALQTIINQQILAEASAQAAGFTTHHHREDMASKLNDQILSVNSVDHHPSPALHQLYAAKLRDTILANMTNAR